MKSRRLERGVSALEALAALAVLAIVMIPLLELQAQIARATITQENAARRLEAQRNALALLRDINPSARPEGEIALGPGEFVRWRATPLTEETRNRAYPAGDGAFLVRLYSVAVSVSGPKTHASFKVERLGWRPVEDEAATSASPRTRREPRSLSP